MDGSKLAVSAALLTAAISFPGFAAQAAEFRAFIAKAGERPEYAQQVLLAKDRLRDVVSGPKFVVQRCVPAIKSTSTGR